MDRTSHSLSDLGCCLLGGADLTNHRWLNNGIPNYQNLHGHFPVSFWNILAQSTTLTLIRVQNMTLRTNIANYSLTKRAPVRRAPYRYLGEKLGIIKGLSTVGRPISATYGVASSVVIYALPDRERRRCYSRHGISKSHIMACMCRRMISSGGRGHHKSCRHDIETREGSYIDGGRRQEKKSYGGPLH